MLPFDNKPWAKHLASMVICFTVIGVICLGFYLEHVKSLHVSEWVMMFLILLTIVPPNLAVLYRKPKSDSDIHPYNSHRNGHGVTAH